MTEGKGCCISPVNTSKREGWHPEKGIKGGRISTEGKAKEEKGIERARRDALMGKRKEEGGRKREGNKGEKRTGKRWEEEETRGAVQRGGKERSEARNNNSDKVLETSIYAQTEADGQTMEKSR